MTTVSGSVALVTGAAGGIGAAIGDALSGAGAVVVRADLAGVGGTDVALDVTEAAAVEAAVADLVADHGRLDIVVHAAGIGVGGPIESIPLDEWQRAVDVNLWGTIHLVRAAYPTMIERGRGHIALVASLSGLVGTPLLVPYATTKTAVVGLAASLRPEAARHGIGVTAICPGPVDTRMLDDGGTGGSIHGIDVRRYLTNAAGPAIPAAKVGAATVRAIGRDTAVVTPGRARWVYLGARLAPAITERILAWGMRRELTAGQ